MKQKFFRILLFIGIPFTYVSAWWLRFVRNAEAEKFSDKIFMKLGILPVLDHYYQPLINPKKYLIKSLRENRDLPGINFNTDEQLALLEKFKYNEELLKIPFEKTTDKIEYYYNNSSYGSGDGEYLYNIIRYFKPVKIIEIGSGLSTLMARNAIEQNKIEIKNYECNHICIEPYERQWLEQTGVEVIRKKVETIDKSLFQKLKSNDILFIDSSHIIRTQGDVLFEYLEILPELNSGVLVHIHDIFSPKDYLEEWVNSHLMWNEQYLLEAFLTFNSKFRIIGSLNYLAHNYYEKLSAKCPVFSNQQNREPGAFWIIKN